MAFVSKLARVELLISLSISLIVSTANPCRSQEALFIEDTNESETGVHSFVPPVDFSTTDQTSEASNSAASTDANGTTEDQWHIAFLPYPWFAGMHGTTAVHGFTTSVHASAGDLLSHFNIGLMGTLQASKDRRLLSTDLMWIRLSDEHSFPENLIGVDSIDFRAGQFLLTPEVGYQIIDQPKVKVAGLVGFRYWHLEEKLAFSPALFGGVATSANWVDAIGGGRIQIPLSARASIIISGNAGGGGASPDYQLAGLLGLQVKKSVALQAGWRYLDVLYRNSAKGFLYDVAASGALVGATFQFK